MMTNDQKQVNVRLKPKRLKKVKVKLEDDTALKSVVSTIKKGIAKSEKRARLPKPKKVVNNVVSSNAENDIPVGNYNLAKREWEGVIDGPFAEQAPSDLPRLADADTGVSSTRFLVFSSQEMPQETNFPVIFETKQNDDRLDEVNAKDTDASHFDDRYDSSLIQRHTQSEIIRESPTDQAPMMDSVAIGFRM